MTRKYSSNSPVYRSWIYYKNQGMEGFASYGAFADACYNAGWKKGRVIARKDMEAPMSPGNLIVLTRQDMARWRGKEVRKEASPMDGCPWTIAQLAERYGVGKHTIGYALYSCGQTWETLEEWLKERVEKKEK